MTSTLVKALALLVPTMILLAVSVALVWRTRTLWAWLQLGGAVCLVVVVLTHLCEALHLLPWMGWGEPHSVGHYLDFVSAVGGMTLLPVGYWAGRHRQA